MGSPPTQVLDSGLSGLSLIAGYYRIAADPAQLRHQLALTGRWRGRKISFGRQSLRLKSRILRGVDGQASRRHSLSGDPRPEGRRLRGARRRPARRAGCASSIRSRAPRRRCRSKRPRSCRQAWRSWSRDGSAGPGSIPTRSASAGSGRRFCATGGRSPTCWSPRCSCSCSRWRRRSSSSSWSTRCWSTRACRLWSCSSSAW